MAVSQRWSIVMRRALYGPDGFYRVERPARHFRTSSQSRRFADGVGALAARLDEDLGRPDVFTIVDVGAGDGELVAELLRADRSGRWRGVAVEVRSRPDALDGRVEWRGEVPESVTGLILACEWLDNVPCDIAEVGADGRWRYQLVDAASGETCVGGLVDGADAEWLARWWPVSEPGGTAAIGRARDEAFAGLVDRLDRGAVLAVDYGHTVDARPAHACVAGFADGRAVAPVPDGSRDITVHVAMDSLGGGEPVAQRTALRSLGVDGRRPPLALARTDPRGYLAALNAAAEGADLTDPAGLGAHLWLLCGRGTSVTL